MDEPTQQAELAASLFRRLERGEETVFLEEVTVAEVVWTLRSFYHMPKQTIVETVLELLAADSIQASDKQALQVAIHFYNRLNSDFADGLIAAKALQDPEPSVYSFDRDFDRVPGLVRKEPR